MFVARNLVDALATIIDYALWAYMWAFILRAVLSWVSPDPSNPIVRGLYAVTEPVLSRLRRKLPLFAGSIDFAPMVAVLVIVFLQRFVVRTLFDLALPMPLASRTAPPPHCRSAWSRAPRRRGWPGAREAWCGSASTPHPSRGRPMKPSSASLRRPWVFPGAASRWSRGRGGEARSSASPASPARP